MIRPREVFTRAYKDKQILYRIRNCPAIHCDYVKKISPVGYVYLSTNGLGEWFDPKDIEVLDVLAC